MLLKRLACINNTKPGLQWAQTKTFLSSGLLPPSMCRKSLHQSAKMHLQGQRETGINGEVEGGWRSGGMGGGWGQAESISIISASAAWLADVKAEWPRLTVMLQRRGSATTTAWKDGCNQWSWLFLSVPWSVPGLGSITSTDGAIAHVARLAGTQVSFDGVGADGVLIAHILVTGALVVLWGGQRWTLY